MLGAYRRALDGIVSAALAALIRLLRGGYDPETPALKMSEELALQVVEPLRMARQSAYNEAVKFIRETAAAQGISNPYIPDQSGYSSASPESVLRDVMRNETRDPQRFPQVAAEHLVQHVEDAARQAVVRTVEDFRRPVPEDEAHWSYDARSPEEEAEYARDTDLALNWARVLTGQENCGFCVMLASRGPVYETAETAGRIRASAEFRAVNGRRWMNSYHPNCDCVVVPVYDYGNWAGRDQWQALEKWYDKVIHKGTWTDKDGNVHTGFKYNDASHDAKNNVIAELDRVLRQMERDGEQLPVVDVRTSW